MTGCHFCVGSTPRSINMPRYSKSKSIYQSVPQTPFIDLVCISFAMTVLNIILYNNMCPSMSRLFCPYLFPLSSTCTVTVDFVVHHCLRHSAHLKSSTLTLLGQYYSVFSKFSSQLYHFPLDLLSDLLWLLHLSFILGALNTILTKFGGSHSVCQNRNAILCGMTAEFQWFISFCKPITSFRNIFTWSFSPVVLLLF